LRHQKRCIKGTIIQECGHFITQNNDFYGILDDYLQTVL